jgi:hypothetical protein
MAAPHFKKNRKKFDQTYRGPHRSACEAGKNKMTSAHQRRDHSNQESVAFMLRQIALSNALDDIVGQRREGSAALPTNKSCAQNPFKIG